jgi:hypothetical protein
MRRKGEEEGGAGSMTSASGERTPFARRRGDRPCTPPAPPWTWVTLEKELACAHTIDRRRASALRNRQAELHVRALPVSLVYQCSSRATMVSCDRLFRRGPTHFCQPPRGQRQNAPHTTLIVAIANRFAHIDRADDHAP